MSKASLVKHSQSYQGVFNLLQLLEKELEEKIKNLKKIVVKINFVTTENELATTPVETVKAFVDFIKPFFSGKIIIAEEASLGNTKDGFERFGFTRLAQKEPQVEVFDSADDEAEVVKIEYPGGELSIPLAKIYLESPFIISLCRPKTHDTVVVTLGIKNLLIGAIQGGLRERGKIHRGKAIHWVMKEIAKHAYPNLVVIDGVVGMEGNGPANGIPIHSGWLVASLDALAADSLASYLMGFDINDIGYLNLLRQEGFGKLYPKDKIKIVGENPKKLITRFKPHDTFENQRKWR